MYNKIDNWFIENTTSDREILTVVNGHVISLGPSSFIQSKIISNSITASGDNYYRIQTIISDININLPKVSSNPHVEITIKLQLDNLQGNVVTLLPYGSDTIEGQTSYVLDVPRMCFKIKSDSVSEWMIS